MNQSPTAKIDKSNLPQHVAIIMDGNGRWARKQGLDRTFGHRNAVESVRAAIEVCGDLDIPYLTLFAFSTENWKRPKTEVSFLMKLLSSTIKSEIDELDRKGIRLLIIGQNDKLPPAVLKQLQKAIDRTKDNKKATLIIALNYGSKDEIVNAAKKIAEDVKSGNIEISDIDQDLFEQNLYTGDIPNVDLLIRTSGEYRISNFLLWQIAYAELYFTKTLWPDFRQEDFLKAIREYSSRERRYGKTGEQIKTE
ncbi:MAG: isoprenyl transferase [Flavobacteriia bacterium]|nr:isoprenyl transferase [Flavobacteriia bacterium]